MHKPSVSSDYLFLRKFLFAWVFLLNNNYNSYILLICSKMSMPHQYTIALYMPYIIIYQLSVIGSHNQLSIEQTRWVFKQTRSFARDVSIRKKLVNRQSHSDEQVCYPI